ncbi:MAG TPA: RagB/SusD family nutrient uptake outer membrane protein [Saprospiraceae bacterium]|nr:RagB/SusD family nutrient uptake outer membrane protein [Saprospiraceae bacterium]HMP25228.1 RagB/SusD family nutrient uptake outer membrane protein [Saprospiraceae bacterium]
MKHRFFRMFFALSLLWGAAACTDFLEKEPLGLITEDAYFKTPEHAVEAVNAVYNMLRRWEVHVFSYIGMTDIISDDADKGSTPTDASFLLELENFSFNATNIAPLGVWQGYYRGIHRANVAIERIPQIEMNAALRDRLVGEAKFLRGYFYFNLVRWFGDVPLITRPLPPDEFKQPRAPKEQVYAQIIKDLEEAAAVLPATHSAADRGRVTRGSANGMLAKVYLTLGDFQRTEQYALTVINSGTYALFPNYERLFQKEGEMSSESVFEVVTTADQQGLGGSQFNEVQGVRGVPNLGWGFNRPSDDLIRAYEPGDPRREATILYVGEVLPDGTAIVEDNPETINERYNQKAWVPRRPDGRNGAGGGNIRILRYADVLLMAAEALNENGKTQEALTYLNQVRTRARGTRPATVLPNVTVTDRAQLRQRIWQERRVELAMEQQRWFDLLRQGRAGAVMKALGKNFQEGKHELFPIPQNEVDLSGGLITQNPNY